jgi:hypothetical protein
MTIYRTAINKIQDAARKGWNKILLQKWKAITFQDFLTFLKEVIVIGGSGMLIGKVSLDFAADKKFYNGLDHMVMIEFRSATHDQLVADLLKDISTIHFGQKFPLHQIPSASSLAGKTEDDEKKKKKNEAQQKKADEAYLGLCVDSMCYLLKDKKKESNILLYNTILSFYAQLSTLQGKHDDEKAPFDSLVMYLTYDLIQKYCLRCVYDAYQSNKVDWDDAKDRDEIIKLSRDAYEKAQKELERVGLFKTFFLNYRDEEVVALPSNKANNNKEQIAKEMVQPPTKAAAAAGKDNGPAAAKAALEYCMRDNRKFIQSYLLGYLATHRSFYDWFGCYIQFLKFFEAYNR